MKANPKQFVFSPFANQQKASIPEASNTPGAEESKKTYTQNDLDTAEKNAHAKGHAEGLSAGVEQGKGELLQAEQQLNATLSALVAQLSQVTDELNRTIEERYQETVKLAVTIAKKVAGEQAAEAQEKKIEEFVEQTLPKIFKEKSLSLSVHPDFSQILEQKVEALIKEHSSDCKIKITPDPAIPNTACKIEWDNGGVEYNIDAIWQEIHKALGTSASEAPPPKATAQVEDPPAENESPPAEAAQETMNEDEKKPEDETTKT